MLDSAWPHPSTVTTAAFSAVVLIAAALLFAAIAFALTRQGTKPGKSRALAAAGVLGWMTLTGAYVASGTIEKAPPFFIAFFALSNLAALALGLSKIGKTLATETPLVALIGVHAFRLPLELVLHQMAEEGSLPVQMTYLGHNFDLVTGLAAIVIFGAYGFGRQEPPRVLAIAFNLVGTVLLVAILVIVIRSSPLPLKAYPGPSIQLGFHLPFAWIAPICVGGALFGHVVLWRSLLSGSYGERVSRVSSA